MNITTATPAEIDTQLNELGYRRFVLISRVESAEASIEKLSGEGSYYADRVEAMRKMIEDALPKIEALTAEIAPLNAEFDRRGGWTRSFLVTNNNGHAHKDRNCGTCFPTTRYAWMTAFSGMDEAEIVDAAGERACTVCYPSAPVSVLNQPTRMFTPDEEAKAAARAEREAKAASKNAAKVIDPETGKELFKTERGATNAIAGALKDMRWYGFDHPSQGEWEREVTATINALAARNGTDPAAMRAEFDAKADKAHLTAMKKAWKELKADCASGRWSREFINTDSPAVQYGKSIGEELVFPES